MTPLSLPSALLPYRVFRERLRKLGFQPAHPDRGGGDRAVATVGGMRVVVVHSGYGEGYGGQRPVRVVRYYLEQTTGLDEQDIERNARAVIEPLIAPGPSLHAYHPSAIAERLAAFWATVGARRYRTISAPEDWIDELARVISPAPAELAERLKVYAELAAHRGESLSVCKGKLSDVKVLFEGAPPDLLPKIEEVIAGIGDSRFRVRAGPLEVLEREAPKKGGSMGALATTIANAKKQRRLTWLQADAIRGEGLVFSGTGASVIKSALKEMAQADKEGIFEVVIDGDKSEVKARKLPKLAATLAAAVRSGKSVRIGADAQERPSAELRF